MRYARRPLPSGIVAMRAATLNPAQPIGTFRMPLPILLPASQRNIHFLPFKCSNGVNDTDLACSMFILQSAYMRVHFAALRVAPLS